MQSIKQLRLRVSNALKRCQEVVHKKVLTWNWKWIEINDRTGNLFLSLDGNGISIRKQTRSDSRVLELQIVPVSHVLSYTFLSCPNFIEENVLKGTPRALASFARSEKMCHELSIHPGDINFARYQSRIGKKCDKLWLMRLTYSHGRPSVFSSVSCIPSADGFPDILCRGIFYSAQYTLAVLYLQSNRNNLSVSRVTVNQLTLHSACLVNIFAWITSNWHYQAKRRKKA